jgi:hypothetical protein
MNPPALGVALPSLLSPRPRICECAAVLLSRALLLTSLTGTVAILSAFDSLYMVLLFNSQPFNTVIVFVR